MLHAQENPREVYAERLLEGIEVDFLVNNAGYAVARSFLRADWSTQEDFLNVVATWKQVDSKVDHLSQVNQKYDCDLMFNTILLVRNMIFIIR